MDNRVSGCGYGFACQLAEAFDLRAGSGGYAVTSVGKAGDLEREASLDRKLGRENVGYHTVQGTGLECRIPFHGALESQEFYVDAFLGEELVAFAEEKGKGIGVGEDAQAQCTARSLGGCAGYLPRGSGALRLGGDGSGGEEHEQRCVYEFFSCHVYELLRKGRGFGKHRSPGVIGRNSG